MKITAINHSSTKNTVLNKQSPSFGYFTPKAKEIISEFAEYYSRQPLSTKKRAEFLKLRKSIDDMSSLFYKIDIKTKTLHFTTENLKKHQTFQYAGNITNVSSEKVKNTPFYSNANDFIKTFANYYKREIDTVNYPREPVYFSGLFGDMPILLLKAIKKELNQLIQKNY